MNIVADVRKYKSEKNISIKEVVDKIIVYTDVDVSVCVDDLKNVCNVGEICVKSERGWINYFLLLCYF